jgi:hypothetical protein
MLPVLSATLKSEVMRGLKGFLGLYHRQSDEAFSSALHHSLEKKQKRREREVEVKNF